MLWEGDRPRWAALRNVIPEVWRHRLRELQVALAFEHVCGPKAVDPGSNGVVVTCLVKNGAFYLEQFIAHYFSLGVSHICFLDNGSTDDTIDGARRHRNVTVYRCALPVSAHQPLLKKSLAQRAVRNGWCLDVDIDEFFDYPYSDTLELSAFVSYLNSRGYTAVLTQMLDMFSDQPLEFLSHPRGENLKEAHRFYDLSRVERTRYYEDALTVTHGKHNRVASDEASVYRGGIRMSMWGVSCLLTKHSLFRIGVGLRLFPHVHFVDGANLADVSCALLHYKFASNARDEATQNRTAFAAISGNYDRILQTIALQPSVRVKGHAAEEFQSSRDLLANGFLFASREYRAYARAGEAESNGSTGG
jgi:hypothetical protein